MFPNHTRAFAPRFGISWDPFSNGKTAVRAGYGIFYDRWGSYSQFGAFSPPFNTSVNISNTSLDNPGGVSGTVFPSALNAPLSPWKYPAVQKWSLSIQREIAPATTASVAYVGTAGAHLLGFYDLNQGQPNANVANGVVAANYLRPFKGYSTITAYSTQFNSNYNALQATLLHRLWAGLSFQASYTYSKALTDNTGPNSSYISFPQDTYNLRSEYGPADFDRTHILTFNYSWELPLFRHTNGFKESVLGGWQVSGITVFQSGAPNTVVLSGDYAGVGNFNGNERPNQVGNPFQAGSIAGNPTCVAPAQIRTVPNWFNPCAFEIPAPGTFGNEGIGEIRGPRYQNWDFGLGKNLGLRESVSLQFKFEAFNVFNHPSLSLPTYSAGLYETPGDVTPFSSINSATSPRTLQFSLALKF